MKKVIMSDETLKAAAAQVRDAMLDEVFAAEEEEHVFSVEFEETMEKCYHVKQREYHFRKFAVSAAAMVVAVIGVSCWLASSGGDTVSDVHASNDSQTARNNHTNPGYENPDSSESTVMYSGNYQFSVDGLVYSVIASQAPQERQSIHVDGSSGEHYLTAVNGMSN